MTIMNKITLLLLAVCFVTGASAQKADVQNLSFGVDVGPNLSGARVHDPSTKVTGAPGLGFEVGAFANLPFAGSPFSFRPRLQYSYESYTPHLYGDKYPVHMPFVKLPLDVVYNSSLGGGKWFFGAGPYLAMAVGGSFKANYGDGSQKIHYGSDPDNDEAKRGDIGLDLMAGYKLMDNIVLSANVDFGFVNILNTPYWGNGQKAHTLNFGITGGYIFGGK